MKQSLALRHSGCVSPSAARVSRITPRRLPVVRTWSRYRAHGISAARWGRWRETQADCVDDLRSLGWCAATDSFFLPSSFFFAPPSPPASRRPAGSVLALASSGRPCDRRRCCPRAADHLCGWGRAYARVVGARGPAGGPRPAGFGGAVAQTCVTSGFGYRPPGLGVLPAFGSVVTITPLSFSHRRSAVSYRLRSKRVGKDHRALCCMVERWESDVVVINTLIAAVVYIRVVREIDSPVTVPGAPESPGGRVIKAARQAAPPSQAVVAVPAPRPSLSCFPH